MIEGGGTRNGHISSPKAAACCPRAGGSMRRKKPANESRLSHATCVVQGCHASLSSCKAYNQVPVQRLAQPESRQAPVAPAAQRMPRAWAPARRGAAATPAGPRQQARPSSSPSLHNCCARPRSDAASAPCTRRPNPACRRGWRSASATSAQSSTPLTSECGRQGLLQIGPPLGPHAADGPTHCCRQYSTAQHSRPAKHWGCRPPPGSRRSSATASTAWL
jgi:hypothetical protein